MLQRKGGISRQSGFLARSLISYPISSMGERQYKEPPESLSALEAFHARIIYCLEQSTNLTKDGCNNLPILNFSSNAKNLWVKFYNEIEAGLKSKSDWLDIQDFASKAAENAARLSALFHLFSGKDGNIESESIEQAIEIIKWHLLETRGVLNLYEVDNQQNDAIKLIRWIKAKQLKQFTPRFLQQYSPIRNKAKRDNAIELLASKHYLQEVILDGVTTLVINPNLFDTI